MIQQHYSAQKRKTRATKKLGDLWQNNPELQEILDDSNGSKKWLRLTAIASQTSRDPELVKRCLNHAYVYRLLRLNRKSKPSKWYTSGDFQEAKRLVDIGCPQLDEAIDFHAMGLKFYRGLVIRWDITPAWMTVTTPIDFVP